MVHELAIIDVTQGAEEDFLAAYRQARELIGDAAGVGTVRMTRGVETPTRFVLHVEWESVEAHQAFRDSRAFGEWRALIGPHFAAPPQVEHYVDVD